MFGKRVRKVFAFRFVVVYVMFDALKNVLYKYSKMCEKSQVRVKHVVIL